LVGAGLFLNSFVRLIKTDVGVDFHNLGLVAFESDDYRYPTGAERYEYFTTMQERLRAIPGIDDVTLAMGAPPWRAGMLMFDNAVEFDAVGPAPEKVVERLLADDVQPNYFKVMGIPIVAGRSFDTSDNPEDNPVIIDREFARFLWAGEDAVGKRFRLDGREPWYTVIGLVGDVKLQGPREDFSQFEMFLLAQEGLSWRHRSFAFRSSSDVRRLFPAIKQAVWSINPNQTITYMLTGSEAFAKSIDEPRFVLTLVGIMAGVALVLAAVGVYGVLAFSVSRRTRELAIRMALGAKAETLRVLVLRDGLLLTGMGIVLGLALAVAVSRFAVGLLYQIEPTDPETLGVVAFVMLVVAAMAAYLPARRATLLDPMVSLNVE